MPELSIVIPVYCGEYTVVPLYKKIVTELEKIHSFEIIFVHDCGPDNSLHVLQEIKREDPDRVKVVQLTRNFGQHNATICGFKHCSGNLIVTMDEDLQHDPADIQLLIQEQNQNNRDLVYGSTGTEYKHSFFRVLTSSLMRRIIRIACPNINTDYTAYRIIKREIAIETLQMSNSYTFLDGYLAWLTSNTSSVKVNHHERLKGKSGYSLNKLIRHSINICITFSNLPIRIISIIAALVFLTSSIYTTTIIYNVLSHPQSYQAGFPTISVSIGLGTSLILMGIATLGEYLWQVNQKATRRPTFLEKK